MIIVNPSTRQFNIPGSDLTFGVEADAGSERKYFQCPRYVGNRLDIASSFVRINYRNANGEIDSYLVEDLTVDGDNVLFSWELYPKVTAYKGQLKFVMCVTGPDTKVAWHTTLGTGMVLEGLEPDYAVIQAGTADVVAQLIAMTERQTKAVEDTGAEWVRNVQLEGTDQIIAVQTAGAESKAAAVAEIEAKGKNVRESIPDDYTALSEAVDSLVRGRAGAIVCEAEGTAVVVKDASDMAMQGLRIFGRSTQDGVPTPANPVEIVSVESPAVSVSGKNLCAPTAFSSMTEAGKSTNTYDPDSLTVTMVANPATVAGRYCVPLRNLAIGKSYVVSFDLRGTAGRSVKCGWDRNPARITLTDSFVRYSSVVVATRKDEPIIFYSVAIADGGLATGEFLQFANVQIEPGTIANAYEPYKPVQTIITTNILHGVPVESGGNYTDENGQHWLCDEVDLNRGVLIKRLVSHTLTGDMLMYVWTDTERERGITVRGLSMDYSVRRDPMALCTHYKTRANGSVVSGQIGIRLLGDYTSLYLLHEEGVATTMEEWRAFFYAQIANGTPVTILAKAEHEIETPLSETEIAAYRAMHTYKPNTTIINDSGAHMKVEYAADTKLYIDNKLAALVGNT